jgi:hypothetical protein
VTVEFAHEPLPWSLEKVAFFNATASETLKANCVVLPVIVLLIQKSFMVGDVAPEATGIVEKLRP